MSFDVRGKTVLITGATSGIGQEAAVELGRKGAKLVLVGRDRAKTDAAVADVKARGNTSDVESLLCDFSSQQSIRDCAAAFRARHDQLHVLLNNAGGVNAQRRVTVDGIEATFATNHLGYFLFTNLLRDLLVKSAPARVVVVASVGHRRGTMDFDDLGFEKGGYSIMAAYARSKLGNVLFTSELARRLEGTGVTANSCHPGAVDTNIWSGAPSWAKPILRFVVRPFFISAADGAEPLVRLASDPALDGVTGGYWERRKRVDPAPLGRDAALAARLWDVSARMVKLPDEPAAAKA